MDFDADAIRNPKRSLARRMAAAEDEAQVAGSPATPASAPAKGMSQADFSGYTSETPEQKKAKAAKLAQLLRSQ